jgi:glycosyltransferase involved in cell wall biosynthesis
MKILLVSRFFPYVGGREVLVMLMARELSKNHQVTIATPDVGRVSADYEIVSNETKFLDGYIKKFKPDVIHSHTFYMTPDLINLAKSHKIPIALTVHGDIFGFGSDRDKKLLSSMFPQLNAVVVVCNHGQKRLVNNGIEADKVTRIYPGVDIKMFGGCDDGKGVFRRAFSLPEDKYIFITPARMISYKGIEILLDAIADLDSSVRSKMFFWITTPATRYREDELEYTKTIFKKAKVLGIQDDLMLSFADFTSMPFAYRAADAFVLPSFTEQFPVTILEALVSNLPVIATDVGGVGEMIGPKTGNLIKPGDAKVLSKALQEVYENPDLSKVEQSERMVKDKFNLERMVNEYLDLYKKMVL